MINYPGRAQSIVRKKFAGRGTGLMKDTEAMAMEDCSPCYSAFFLVHLRALVIL